MASIQSGKTVVPRLVKSVDVSVPAEAEPLTAKEAKALRQMLRGVVTSGSGRGFLDVPGPPVIAKTGTAEFGSEEPLQTHAWMVAGQGDLAVAVFVDVGDSGSGTAGPLLEQMLRVAR
jgi:cell division protein FtsI/penicillin-binding protein 2